MQCKTIGNSDTIHLMILRDRFSSVQFSRSVVSDSATPWIAARHASLSITNSRSPHKPMSIELVMPSNHLILSHPLLLMPSIFPSIRVFSNEPALHIRGPKYWSFSFNISLPMNTQDWSPLGWTGWISLKAKGLSRVFSNTTVQKHHFFCTQLSLYFNSLDHQKKEESSIKNIYFCFIDYAKSFDSVDHNKLWKILREMGIPNHLTRLLRNLYVGQEATVRTGHGTTD